MRTVNMIDSYMTFLSTLSRERKIALATRLLDSASSKNHKKAVFSLDTRFSGDWGKDKSAEEVARELRNARKFTRNVDMW